MKTIEEVQNYLNIVDNINEGGCGIAALSMFRWLKKHNKVNKSFRFVYLYQYLENFKQNSKALKNKSNTPTVCNHACILYQGMYLDSTGIVDTSNYNYIHHISEEDFMIHSINNIPRWNNEFDRESVFEIESILKIDLSDVYVNFKELAQKEPHRAFTIDKIEFCNYVREYVCMDLNNTDIEEIMKLKFEDIELNN